MTEKSSFRWTPCDIERWDKARFALLPRAKKIPEKPKKEVKWSQPECSSGRVLR